MTDEVHAPDRTKTILLLLLQEPSAFNASFRLARGLTESGCTVVYAVFPELRDYVARHGFQTELLEIRWAPTTGPTRRGRRSRAMRRKHETVISAVDDLAARLPAVDLLLIDQIVWWLAEPFLRRRVRIVGVSTNLAWRWSARRAPVFVDAPAPAENPWLAAAQAQWAWFKLLVRNASDSHNVSFYHLVVAGLLGRTPHLFRRRRLEALGAKVRWGEYGYRLDVPELVLGPRELDYPTRPPFPDRCFAGSAIETERLDGLLPWSDGADHDQSAFDWSRVDTSRQLVYCSLGSHAHSMCRHRQRLYRAAIQAAARRPDIQLVMQVTAPDEAQSVARAAPHCVVSRWAPQLALLSRASLFITHAGFSSMRESVYCGVPMVAFPFFNDGYGNAARIVHHRLGLRGDIETVTPEQLGALIDRVRRNPAIRASVARMRAVMREQEACEKGVEFVRRFL